MQVKIFNRILLALIFSAMVTSCGTTQLSKSDVSGVDAGKKAVVKTYNRPLVAGMIFGDEPVTKIIAVDGVKVGGAAFKLDEQVAIDIGIHKIEFSCSNRSGYDERDSTEIIELDLKPNHEYLVRCSFDSSYGDNGSYQTSFSIKEKRLN